jgi:hypothetical protein
MPLTKAQKTIETKTWAGSTDDLITLVTQISKAVEPARQSALAEAEARLDRDIQEELDRRTRYGSLDPEAGLQDLREALSVRVRTVTEMWEPSVEVLLKDGVLETYGGDPADLGTKFDENQVKRVKVAAGTYSADPRVTLTLDKYGVTLNVEASDAQWVRSAGEDLRRLVRRQETFGSFARSPWGWVCATLGAVLVATMIVFLADSSLRSDPDDGRGAASLVLTITSLSVPLLWAWAGLTSLLWPGLELRQPHKRNTARWLLGSALGMVLAGLVGWTVTELLA